MLIYVVCARNIFLQEYFYRYKKFDAGSFDCRRGFYILQVMNFEGQTDDHGWGSCPGRNFVDEAPNGYTIQVFD